MKLSRVDKSRASLMHFSGIARRKSMLILSGLAFLAGCAPFISKPKLNQPVTASSNPLPVTVAWAGFQQEYTPAKIKGKLFFTLETALRSKDFESPLKNAKAFQKALIMPTIDVGELRNQAAGLGAAYILNMKVTNNESNDQGVNFFLIPCIALSIASFGLGTPIMLFLPVGTNEVVIGGQLSLTRVADGEIIYSRQVESKTLFSFNVYEAHVNSPPFKKAEKVCWQNLYGEIINALKTEEFAQLAIQSKTYYKRAPERKASPSVGRPVKQYFPPQISLPSYTGPKSYLAVMDLENKSGISRDENYLLSDKVRESFLRTGRFTVVERNRMQQILREQAFQGMDCTQSSCAVEMGRILNVQKMALGKIGKMGDTYYVTLSLVNVETGEIEASASEQCPCSPEELPLAIEVVVKKLILGQ